MEKLYKEWIQYLFNRPETEWYWDFGLKAFEASNEELICQWKDVVLDVMEDALYIPNDACIESALHGLGHRYSQDEIKVPDIIDRFLSKAKNLNPDLRIYAQSAKTGCIQ